MVTVLAFIGVFGLLILIHELGHFVTAKLSKVKVMEFGFGYPPRILSFRKGETLYSLNLLPLGGFVKMEGEENPASPRSLASKPIPVRAVVIGAGAFMNAILPIALFTVIFMVPQTIIVGDVIVREVAPGSPAASAGLQPGDQLLKVDGRTVSNSSEVSYNFHLNLGAETPVLVQRGDTTFTATMVPRWKPPEGQGPTGVRISTESLHEIKRSYPFWKAVPKGFRQTWDTLVAFKNEVALMFVRKQAPQVAGPVGIAQLTGEVAQAGIVPLLGLTALLSLNLAILNILPLPALDGGRLFFLLIEAVRRKRIPPEREALIHLTGFIIIIALALFISYFDILRIVRGDSLVR